MESTTKEGTLRVPGATLYYKTRGSGPVLLILQGGGGDADASDGVVDHLVDHYAVITYDRRGLSRSTLDDSTEPPKDLGTHSDDVHRLLAALATEPALVLGTSLGALIGLDLVARHPDQVRTFVAHEPPAIERLPEAERVLAQQAQKALEESTTSEERAAVMKKIGVSYEDREPDVAWPQPTAQMIANAEFFRTNDAPVAHRYRLDLDGLHAASTRIVLAGGQASRDAFPHRCAQTVAETLGTEFVEFPGDHAGFATRPRAFAERLREVLGGTP